MGGIYTQKDLDDYNRNMMIIMIIGIILMVISSFAIIYPYIYDSEYSFGFSVINYIFFIIGLFMFGYKFVIGDNNLPIVGNTYL
jgi:hypothetical protein